MDVPDSEYRLINDDVFGIPSPTGPSDTPASFTCFPLFPAEIKLEIWKHALGQGTGRLFHLLMTVDSVEHLRLTDWPLSRPYRVRNHLGNITSGYPYELIVTSGDHRNDWARQSLMRVNIEAYSVCTSKYRIRMPRRRLTRIKSVNKRTSRLRIDPATDIIQISWDDYGHTAPPEAFVAFLHNTVAYDPLGQGISHLAMGLDLVAPAQLERSKIHPLAFRSVSTLLSRGLKTFYATVCNMPETHPPGGRTKLYPLSVRDLKGTVPEFTILPQDPRQTEVELDFLFHEINKYYKAHATYPWTNSPMYSWYHIMAKFKVPIVPTPPMQLRYLFSTSPPRFTAGGRRLVWCSWASYTRAAIIQPLTDLDADSPPDDKRSVIGAWIFDCDVFGPIPYDLNKETPEHGIISPGFQLNHLKKKSPELMVFRLGA
ncbi:hypothetical protein V8F06_012439 [Rhypophila decipiens]